MSTPSLLPEGAQPEDYCADAVIDRLKLAMRVKSDVELAAALGLNKSTISTWRSRGRVPYAEAVKQAVDLGASLDWILTGRTLHKHASGPTAGGIELDVLAVVLYRLWDSAQLNLAQQYKDPWPQNFFRALVIKTQYEEELKHVNNASEVGYEGRRAYVEMMMRQMGIDPSKDPF